MQGLLSYSTSEHPLIKIYFLLHHNPEHEQEYLMNEYGHRRQNNPGIVLYNLHISDSSYCNNISEWNVA